MKLRLAHYRNRFSMFRIYYALGAGLVKADGLEFEVVEVPDPPSRELEECLIRGDVEIANLYLPNFLERRLAGAPIPFGAVRMPAPIPVPGCSIIADMWVYAP